MLSEEERDERRRARQLLREAGEILKRAGISQNDIAREANYSSGYLPQLLKGGDSYERLTPTAVTRLSTAMEFLSVQATLRLNEDKRVRLRQVLDTLKVGWGETRQDVIGPGKALTPTAGNYLHRRLDNLIDREVAGHSGCALVGIGGPPGAGKSWAIRRAAFAASATHEVCTIDLSLADLESVDGDPDDVVPKLVMRGLSRHFERLSGTNREAKVKSDDVSQSDLGSVREKDLAGGLVRLASVANQERVLVIVDGADRVGDASPLIRLLKRVEDHSYEYDGIERVLVAVVGTVLSTATKDDLLLDSDIHPMYPLSYLSASEVEKLVELWQAAGELRGLEWSALRPDLEVMGGHPRLVSQHLENCRIAGEAVTATKTLEPGSPGCKILTSQFARFADACMRRGLAPRPTVEPWLNGSGLSTDAEDWDDISALVRQFGLITESGAWVPFFKDEETGPDLRRILIKALDRSSVSASEQRAGEA